jgi:hypothetical protein
VPSSVCVQAVNVDITNYRASESCASGLSLVFACGSLHELCRSQKPLLAKIRGTARLLLLIEFAVDHDTPRTGSLALIRNAASMYEFLIKDAYNSLRTRRKMEEVIGGFLLAEFLDILTQPYLLRGNYHLSAPGWQSLLLDAGLKYPRIDTSLSFHSLHMTGLLAYAPPMRRKKVIVRR